MSARKPLLVFEHERLRVTKDGPFKQHHWLALSRYNEQHDSKYFTLLNNGVKFQQYVGVLQVDDLTIEVLPKIGRNNQDKTQWHEIILEMLLECKWMQAESNDTAPLQLKHSSILDSYLEIFLNACESLYHHGLLKQYRRVESNEASLKGKLLLSKQLQKNHIHKERFYIETSVYDTNTMQNRILYKALKEVSKITDSHLLRDKVGRLLLHWPEMQDIKVTEETFERISFNRKNAQYQAPLEIAKMILLEFRPSLKTGSSQVLAIMFDMNKLWEEFIFRRLRSSGKKHKLEVKRQRKKIFWQSDQFPKIVQPDIVINGDIGTIIIDTKWKTYENLRTIDQDLKQMYVYSNLWCAKQTFIVAPFLGTAAEFRTSGHFHIHDEQWGTTKGDVRCSWIGVNVIADDNGRKHLNKELGAKILELIYVF